MARGLGGDDGPSLWMFVACILVYFKLSDIFKSAKDKTSEVLDANWANPTQKETTKDIKTMETAISGLKVDWSKVPKPKTFYERLAIEHRQLMDTGFNLDEDALFAQVEKLSIHELRALAKCFGVQDRSNGVMAIWTGDVFRWYQGSLDNSKIGALGGETELEHMRRIWSKTKLWGF